MAVASSNQAIDSGAQRHVILGRIWWVGLVAMVASIAANAIVAALAGPLLGASPVFPPLQPGGYVFFTVVGVLGAVITFALVARFARRAIRTYLTVATIALALSFVPDLMLMADASQLPGGSVPAVLALMVMHIVTFAISVGLLTSLTRR